MKIHLLLKKEEIDPVQMNQEKLAVVFDVLLATSTITACLKAGAKSIIPVLNEEEALIEAERHSPEEILLVGEYNGITIDGFHDPNPTRLQEHVKGKKVILSTTNGTVAIRKSTSAKSIYVASLLNADAVSNHIVTTYTNETIVAVCSGSKNQFCIEDFYGAGYFISCMVKQIGFENVELTDSALAAKLFFENTVDSSVQLLLHTRIGKMLESNAYDAVEYISRCGVYQIVPKLWKQKYVMLEDTVVDHAY
ncbi:MULTISPECIES: 2-phosphosulfolactate phosphatase [Virgibacillus]|uniref:Probable 2-phosphosulfolactate phosphatase n=1 Tax=Virgibacillus massiliensis TaxID=1462526 RepID=A0A024Q9H7_9BACI|nr:MULTISPECIES: 2-phosphosulfolactate phosphatase [Virgibacillus]EQB37308.1 hypothetical protein M948_01865 [Virgibacillus sp. CM-4]MYL40064.1 2-phosphosulfolactate phosphatase [Virgibacillus massiliensis]CDQ39193.1 putative 2-phosphosulfolactate phosphatase [Virgibacillus massiliensis]